MVTSALVQGILHAYGAPLPDPVANAGLRSLLNVLGTTIGASRHQAVDAIVAVGTAHGGAGSVAIPGRSESVDPLTAARAIGTAAHLDDFDDTHLRTVIHPGAATLAAVWSVGSRVGASGEQVLRAFALGVEAQLRIGNAISPWHYDDGWHITGTCGPIGAAVAAGLLLGQDEAALRRSIGIAASESLGIRDAFGTMMKPFHAGQAGANGVLAAHLAAERFTASEQILEAPRGFFRVLSPNGVEMDRVTDGLGHRWEIERNSFKPYPCGIVSHPAIDAATALGADLPPDDAVIAIEAGVHPLVPELTGNLDPHDGLQARFSTAHGIAVGLVDGEVGLPQYADERVRAADVAALRSLVRYEVDEGCPRDSASVRVTLESGEVLERSVDHARGSEARPLTDGELEDKVERLIEPVLPGRAPRIIAAVRHLGEQVSLDDLDTNSTSSEVSA